MHMHKRKPMTFELKKLIMQFKIRKKMNFFDST